MKNLRIIIIFIGLILFSTSCVKDNKFTTKSFKTTNGIILRDWTGSIIEIYGEEPESYMSDDSIQINLLGNPIYDNTLRFWIINNMSKSFGLKVNIQPVEFKNIPNYIPLDLSIEEIPVDNLTNNKLESFTFIMPDGGGISDGEYEYNKTLKNGFYMISFENEERDLFYWDYIWIYNQ